MRSGANPGDDEPGQAAACAALEATVASVVYVLLPWNDPALGPMTTGASSSDRANLYLADLGFRIPPS